MREALDLRSTFALLCRGGAPPAQQQCGRTLGVGMPQGGEQLLRAERASAAGEPSASVAHPSATGEPSASVATTAERRG